MECLVPMGQMDKTAEKENMSLDLSHFSVRADSGAR